MTICAGIISRVPGIPVEESAREALRRAISRRPGQPIHELGNEECFLLKVDLGAFGAPGIHRDGAGRISLLAGEPLLSVDSGNRTEELRQLHREWARSDWRGLARCRGTFCAVHYDPAAHSLSLIADKIGLRPVYYWVQRKFAVFATSLRILEAIPQIPKEMDRQGATEVVSYGYPLADRTGWSGIRTILAGEIVTISRNRVERSQYWRWDRLPPFQGSIREAAEECYSRFRDAVRIRLRSDRSAIAYLSGGLDSRSIVAVLRELGIQTHTLNFAQTGTQDQVFGAQIARALGTNHREVPKSPKGVHDTYNKAQVTEWIRLSLGEDLERRSKLVWSGDGGSVGVGHVYLTREAVESARAGNDEDAVRRTLHSGGWSIPKRILKPSVAGELLRLPLMGAKAELAQLRSPDPGRALHLFLMANDQRRHLASHFEAIDMDGLEFQLPFFDAEFLQPILTSDIHGFLYHEFYMEWLKWFPPTVLSVPWQVYPGHAPCSLPIPAGLHYQWAQGTNDDKLANAARRVVGKQANDLLRSPDFPSDIISKSTFRIAKFMHQCALGDYTYLLKPALVYGKFSGFGLSNAMVTGACQ